MESAVRGQCSTLLPDYGINIQLIGARLVLVLDLLWSSSSGVTEASAEAYVFNLLTTVGRIFLCKPEVVRRRAVAPYLQRGECTIAETQELREQSSYLQLVGRIRD